MDRAPARPQQQPALTVCAPEKVGEPALGHDGARGGGHGGAGGRGAHHPRLYHVQGCCGRRRKGARDRAHRKVLLRQTNTGYVFVTSAIKSMRVDVADTFQRRFNQCVACEQKRSVIGLRGGKRHPIAGNQALL